MKLQWFEFDLQVIGVEIDLVKPIVGQKSQNQADKTQPYRCYNFLGEIRWDIAEVKMSLHQVGQCNKWGDLGQVDGMFFASYFHEGMIIRKTQDELKILARARES